jgi:hypothetical protein
MSGWVFVNKFGYYYSNILLNIAEKSKTYKQVTTRTHINTPQRRPLEDPSQPMRPKARALAQHGGPPGWLEESNPTQ